MQFSTHEWASWRKQKITHLQEIGGALGKGLPSAVRRFTHIPPFDAIQRCFGGSDTARQDTCGKKRE
jgi:hypothetical protein